MDKLGPDLVIIFSTRRSPQKWDILKTILRIKTKSKPVRKVRTTQHVRTTRYAVANESKVPHGHPNNKTGLQTLTAALA